MGTPVSALGEEGSAVSTARISASRVEEVRGMNPALALRRFSITPKE